MKEELLHFIWKYKLISEQYLKTLQGESISIIQPGIENNADGPDFLNARLKIGNVEWVGNVEIHINSSDWLKHKHSENPKYKNIILHIVYTEDTEIEELTFQKISTLELKGSLSQKLLEQYNLLMSSEKWVPCENEIESIDSFLINSWLDRLLVERVERKTEFINNIFEKSGFHWNQTFFEVICMGFGFKKNADAFNILANRIGYSAFEKESQQGAENVEALFLGTAGFLPKTANHFYIQKLIKLFEFQKSKYGMEVMESKLWVRGAVRPANQPFVRIIQLINFLVSIKRPILELMGDKIIIELTRVLKVDSTGYWKSHHRIQEPKVNGINAMGGKSIDGIFINSILPFQFFYAKWINDDRLLNQSLELFDAIEPEKNSIIERWKLIGIEAASAGKTQALIELKNSYCSKKKCLFCGIGNQILKT
ncbi:DUF2851 family protein [Salibacteraceae bacterium]|nr:DUF2851 family protein [Salibacteraceae bacterium]